MILDTTHTNKSNNQLINDVVGKPFSLLEVFRMKGVGSNRMVIEEVSPNLKPYVNVISDITYANLELRPNGILIRINKGLKNYTWIIPYYHLVIFKSNGSSIHAQGKFIHFKEKITFKENKAFFNKLFNRKIQFNIQYAFIDN